MGRPADHGRPGFWDRAELAERYAEVIRPRPRRSSTSTSRSRYWKLACILEGVYARYLGGALGDRDPAELAPFSDQVDGAAATRWRAAARWQAAADDDGGDHRFVAERARSSTSRCSSSC